MEALAERLQSSAAPGRLVLVWGPARPSAAPSPTPISRTSPPERVHEDPASICARRRSRPDRSFGRADGDSEVLHREVGVDLVSKGADPDVVARTGQTTVDAANGPHQRLVPFVETVKLLEGMGVKNNHRCVSC